MNKAMEQTPTKEYSWLVQHPEIEQRYLGEWIAVFNEKVVSHSRDLNKVLQETAQLLPPPHISYVEEEGLAAYALYLLL
jgi:hypothetical protein